MGIFVRHSSIYQLPNLNSAIGTVRLWALRECTSHLWKSNGIDYVYLFNRFAAMFPVECSIISASNLILTFCQDNVGRLIIDGVVDSVNYYEGKVNVLYFAEFLLILD